MDCLMSNYSSLWCLVAEMVSSICRGGFSRGNAANNLERYLAMDMLLRHSSASYFRCALLSMLAVSLALFKATTAWIIPSSMFCT